MKKSWLTAIGAFSLTLLLPTMAVGGQVKTVEVDCSKGDSIQMALEDKTGELIIEIKGVCRETVVLERDNVTLRGSNPATDGIASLGPPSEGDPPAIPLTIRNAEGFVLENLSFSGGLNGVRIRGSLYDRTPAGSTTGRLVNCRIEDNQNGLVVSDAYLDVFDTTITGSSWVGLITQLAFITCQNCNLVDNESWSVLADRNTTVSLYDSEVTAGGYRGRALGARNNSTVVVRGSTIHSLVAAQAWAYSYIDLRDTEFTGQLLAFDKGMVWLVGATQTTSSGEGHFVGYDGMIEVFLTILEDSLTVDRFGKALLEYDTQINGDLTCEAAGDAWFDGSVTVTGTVSGCEHAP